MAACTVASKAMEDSDREVDSPSDDQESFPASPVSPEPKANAEEKVLIHPLPAVGTGDLCLHHFVVCRILSFVIS